MIPKRATRRLLLYSRTCQHALRAMERLAAAERERPNGLTLERTLARRIGASPDALAQIIHRLRRAGLLRARRGPSGGVALARPAAEISVLEVVRAVDGAGLEGRCILGFPACGDATACPAHPVWKRARALLEARLESRSLEDLARAVQRKNAALRRRGARRSTRSLMRSNQARRRPEKTISL